MTGLSRLQVVFAAQGDFGKPRPVLVIQSDLFHEHPTLTVLPVTGTLVSAPFLRVTVHATPENGLQKTSQIMIDKAITVKLEKFGLAFGRLDANGLIEIERALAVFHGIAK